MSEFEDLLKKLLDHKPEIKNKIYEMIKEKKKIVGAGYLTDQGALFLIASDLGVKLSDPLKIEMSLDELYIGAKEITLEAKVISMSPVRRFIRKDGSELLLRIVIIYDEHSTASVKLWNEKSNLNDVKELRSGDSIKITKAYVRADINGEPVINIGQNSEISKIDNISKIPDIDSITIDVSNIHDIKKNLVISGILSDTIQLIRFVNSKGHKSTALRLSIKGDDGKIMRVILWGKDESDLPRNIPTDTKIKLIGVNSKTGKYGNLEIHGNESTIIDVGIIENELNIIILKILAIIRTGFDHIITLGINQQKSIFKIKNIAEGKINYEVGNTVEFTPSKIYGNTMIIDKDSLVKIVAEYDDIEQRTKITDIIPGKEYCVEAIVLKISDKNVVRTKIGESIEMTSMLIEDDSGNILVKGWREQTKLIELCAIGDIINIINVDAKSGIDGSSELLLNRFTKITKKN
ncbi:MAG: single-stranded DNA-binding protein [Thaumarchaeota archaeon]|nr:single-stranded DNA-binding protein [Nitrososphaerota archaeon]MCY3975840.1 single-stranded DNA-binding protein [Nitrososphaerota archaeon]